MSSKRIEYLDFLKFFAIATVLVGHSTEQLSGDVFWDHPLWAYIYTFHMPLFMFLSGFFFRSSLKKPFSSVLRSKLVQLGVPSVTAFLIGLGIMAAFRVHAIADLCEASFMGFMNSVWFLKCLLFCILVMYPAVKLLRNDIVAAVVVSVVVNLVPGADIVNFNFMLPCFALGMVCGLHEETVDRQRGKLLVLSAVVFAALLPFWSGHLTVYEVPTRILDLSAGTVDWANVRITAYRLAIGLSGTMFFYLLAPAAYRLIAGWRGAERLLDIGRSTLGIYVVQTFLLEIAVHCLGIYVARPWSYLAAFFLAAVELVLCTGTVRLIERSRWARLLILGSR